MMETITTTDIALGFYRNLMACRGGLSPLTFSAAPLSKALHFVITEYYKKTQLAREISGQLFFK
jgi:hypothetical protein